jgi:LmbE family N-acetylglucosaminyl deacetylase
MALKVMSLSVWMLKRLVPIPKVDSGNVYVFVGPHPDDIEIGCGATVAKLVRLGKTVYFVVATDGGAGAKNPETDVEALIRTRRNEASQSATVLGVAWKILAHPDGGRYEATGLAEELALLFLEWKADFAFSPDPDLPSEVHPDHKKVGLAVKEAVFLAANPLALVRRGYTVRHAQSATLAFYYTGRPNRGWRLSRQDVLRQKDAIGKHVSQFPEGHPETVALFRYLNLQKRSAGIRFFTAFADRFRVLGPVHQHCFPEVERY